jgi:hypothetical protein
VLLREKCNEAQEKIGLDCFDEDLIRRRCLMHIIIKIIHNTKETEAEIGIKGSIGSL